MAYSVGGGGIDVGFVVDNTALRAAIAKADKYMGDLVAVNREAAKTVHTEWKSRVPGSGHFRAAGYVRATSRNAYVGLKNTGGRSNDDIGVNEFGGAIPRHQGKARRKRFTYFKHHRPEGYYLVPSLDHKREAITEKYRDHAAEVVHKYMP